MQQRSFSNSNPVDVWVDAAQKLARNVQNEGIDNWTTRRDLATTRAAARTALDSDKKLPLKVRLIALKHESLAVTDNGCPIPREKIVGGLNADAKSIQQHLRVA